MAIIDIIVYFFLFIVAPLSIYLKRTGKTFVEFVKDIIDFFREIGGNEDGGE